MNAIILTAVWGIVMMLAGAFIKTKSTPKYLAIGGLVLIIIANCIELYTKAPFFEIDVKNMLNVNGATSAFHLTFITVLLLCTLLYFLLNGRDIEKVGTHVAEYFALIFFVLCGVTVLSAYNSLLMLFLGVEIMTIPLYILTGSDKKNLKSNEASLKYFLLGGFFNRNYVDGHCINVWC